MLARMWIIPTRVFHGSPQTFQKIRALYLKLDYIQFLPIISSHPTFNFVYFEIWHHHHHHHHHHHLPPWIRSFDLFQHRRFAIVSWGVHDLFFLEVCGWGRVSGVWCRPFFQDGWSSFVCIWVSRLVFQRSLVLFLWLCFLFCPVLCIP